MTDHHVTGLILAGGRGGRMGGIDKGLVNLKGLPLVHHTLKRLQMQEGLQLKEIMIVANRNIDTYETLGVQVWSDNTPTFEGPLAGFQTGLEKCKTSLLLTVPCDSPFFPLNLADRMRSALIAEDAEMAIAATRDPDGRTQPHSVFCLMKCSLLSSLQEFMGRGERKVSAWTALHKTISVPFQITGATQAAFLNANTPEDLSRLESLA